MGCCTVGDNGCIDPGQLGCQLHPVFTLCTVIFRFPEHSSEALRVDYCTLPLLETLEPGFITF